MQPYNNDEQRGYEQGYSPAPQFTAPPPTYYYPPQVPQSQQYTPYPPPQQQQQQYPYPYPQQQMMYPPMPQITINNVNQSNPMMAGKVQLNIWVRLIYFVFIGSWLGLSWLLVALALICTIIGAPVGIVMLAMLPTIFTLHR